jgi:hypothetical protein
MARSVRSKIESRRRTRHCIKIKNPQNLIPTIYCIYSYLYCIQNSTYNLFAGTCEFRVSQLLLEKQVCLIRVK